MPFNVPAPRPLNSNLNRDVPLLSSPRPGPAGLAHASELEGHVPMPEKKLSRTVTGQAVAVHWQTRHTGSGSGSGSGSDNESCVLAS